VSALLPDPLSGHHHRKLSGGVSAGQQQQPSPLSRPPPLSPTPNHLYEMAALTSELDTQAVTTKVKELLLANNLGQKVKGTFYFKVLSNENGGGWTLVINCLAGKCPFPGPNGHHHQRRINRLGQCQNVQKTLKAFMLPS
jgi:hypothetical protein